MENQVAIIGGGAIATCLRRRLIELGYKICFCIPSRNYKGPSYEYLLDKHHPLAVFIAMSNDDNGEAELGYIIPAAKRGIIVITAAKSALSCQAKVLKPYMSWIGFRGALSGGVGIPNYAISRFPNRQRTYIEIVLNGTLNFIFGLMRKGRSLADACAEAIRRGYTEPGASEPLDVINAELMDVVRKICIFYNVVLARKKFLTPHQIGPFFQTAEEVEQLVRNGKDCRFIVSFSNRPDPEVYYLFGKNIRVLCEGWHISAGFRKISSLPEFDWLPSGPGNGMIVVEGEDGKYGTYIGPSGPGAGAEATVQGMLNDLDELKIRHQIR